MSSGDKDTMQQQTFYTSGTAGSIGQEEMPGDASYIESTGASGENNLNTTHTGAFEAQQAQEPTEQEPTAQEPTEQEPTEIDEIREYIGSLASYSQEEINDRHTGQTTTSYEGPAGNEASNTTQGAGSEELSGHKANNTAEQITPEEAAKRVAAEAMIISDGVGRLRQKIMSGDPK